MEDLPISIIVATRNRADYLAAILDALAAQRCRSAFEVVVVDNGSTDETPALLEQYCRADSRFTAEHEPGVGLSRAKNAGVRKARGRVLLFTDDDIVMESRWIAAYESFFAPRRDELLLVGGPVVPVPHDLGQWPSWLGGGLPEFGLPQYGARRLADSEYVWGANMAMPKALFAEIGPWNEGVGPRGDERGTFEDADYQDRVRAAGLPVWFAPTASVHHRVDRAAVTPRRVLAAAFGYGSYEFWRGPGKRAPSERQPLASGLVRLISALLAEGTWILAFRLVPTAWTFERARGSAYKIGYTLERLQAGRQRSRVYRRFRRAFIRARALSLRVAPDHSEGLPFRGRAAMMKVPSGRPGDVPAP